MKSGRHSKKVLGGWHLVGDDHTTPWSIEKPESIPRSLIKNKAKRSKRVTLPSEEGNSELPEEDEVSSSLKGAKDIPPPGAIVNTMQLGLDLDADQKKKLLKACSQKQAVEVTASCPGNKVVHDIIVEVVDEELEVEPEEGAIKDATPPAPPANVQTKLWTVGLFNPLDDIILGGFVMFLSHIADVPLQAFVSMDNSEAEDHVKEFEKLSKPLYLMKARDISVYKMSTKNN